MEVTKIENEKKRWKILLTQIKELAKKMHGFGFRLKMHNKDGINRNRLTRFFQMRNPPRIDTIITMLDALGYEIIIKKKKKKRK